MFWFDSNNSNARYSHNHSWWNNNTDLDTTQEFQKYWTMMAENLTQALLTKDLEISVILEREFSAACCVRAYHIYNWTQWIAEIGSILTSEPEQKTRCSCWRQIRYCHYKQWSNRRTCSNIFIKIEFLIFKTRSYIDS